MSKPLTAFGRRIGHGLRPGRADLRFTPTGCLPGSDGKFAVLCYRAEHGLPLFHPLDPKFEVETGSLVFAPERTDG